MNRLAQTAVAASLALMLVSATPLDAASVAPRTDAQKVRPTPAPQRFPKANVAHLGAVPVWSENDLDASLAGVQFFFSAGGLDHQGINQSGLAALTAEALMRTQVDGIALRQAVGVRGGSVQYTIDPRAVRFYLEAPPGALPELIGLFARALGSPDFSAASVSAASRALAQRIKEVEANALAVGVEMFRRSYYEGAAGFPTLGTPASLVALTSSDVAAFYQANYKRSGLKVSAVGDVTLALGEAVGSLAASLAEGAIPPVAARVRPLPSNPLRIVARRDVGAPIVVVGFAAPSPGNRDFGAMLVLQSLLANAFERSSATTLGVVERSVGATYFYDGTPASLIVYVNGNRADPSVAIRELFLVAKTLGSQPLGADSLRTVKASAEGAFVVDAVTLFDRSYLLGTLAAQGLGADPINAALAAIERTTAVDVQRVAKRYLQRYIVALVLPRTSPAES